MPWRTRSGSNGDSDRTDAGTVAVRSDQVRGASEIASHAQDGSALAGDYHDRMTHDSGISSVEPPAEELRRVQKQRQRFLIGFAVIEGIILAIAMVIVFGLELIDPAVGIWVIVAIALLGGGVLSAYLMISMRPKR